MGSAGEFGEGLASLLLGGDKAGARVSASAEAATLILAETILLHRAWLKSHQKERF